MKKILFPIFVNNKGGNILSTISICKNLDKNLFQITILLIGFKNKRNIYKKIIQKEKINIKYLPFDKITKVLNLNYIFSLFKFLRKNKYDIIHTNDGFLNLSFSIVRLFIKFNQILHIRNTDNSKRNYLSFLVSNKIICISNFVYQKIPNFFNYKKTVMYNYVDQFNNDLKINKKHTKLINKIKKKSFTFCVKYSCKKKTNSIFKNLEIFTNKRQYVFWINVFHIRFFSEKFIK